MWSGKKNHMLNTFCCSSNGWSLDGDMGFTKICILKGTVNDSNLTQPSTFKIRYLLSISTCLSLHLVPRQYGDQAILFWCNPPPATGLRIAQAMVGKAKYKRLQSIVAITAGADGIGAEGRQVSYDADKPSDWVIKIDSLLQKGVVYDSGKKWTIYRVPTNLLKIHKRAFVPKIISIGPFHYRDPRLKVMDEHKERYLYRLLGGKLSKWTSEKHVSSSADDICLENRQHVVGSSRIKLLDLENAMRKMELKTRETYAEVVTMSSERFVEMMVLDGCFIIELMRLFHKSLTNQTDDAIFTTRWMLRTLQRDLLMLENQLPFFVLETLFDLTSTEEEEPSLINLALEFFNPLLPRTSMETKFDDEPEHILDVFLQSFLSRMQQKVEEPQWTFLRHKRSSNPSQEHQDKQLIHCVSELTEAGIKFKKREKHDLLDISFSKGILHIPPLYINDNTVPIFLNFLAYEQCDHEAEPYFTNFFMFFDGLINSSKDVKILHQYEIINHSLGSMENVAKLFNNVCREIVCDLEHCYLSKQMVEVNEYWKAYYATKWHIWWTKLISEYFSTPWTAISLVAAIFLLILTAVQTVYTAISYY